MLLGLAALLLTRKGHSWGSGWVWPMPVLAYAGREYAPVITSGFGQVRPSGEQHRGVDILYQRRNVTDLAAVYKPGTAAGSRGFFCPPGVPVLAAKDGTIWSAEKTARGYAVVISHDNTPFASFYQHLASLNLPAHQRGNNTATGKPTKIKSGELLGVVGGDPTVPPSLRHLHFAVWDEGTDRDAVDPAEAMQAWPRVPWRWTAKEG